MRSLCSAALVLSLCAAACGDDAPSTDSGTAGDSGGRDTRCDDGMAVTCEALPPTCDADSILAARGGCWECVNPLTCRPWGTPECSDTMLCEVDSYCDECASSSCPACDDCIAACVPHDCPTETMLTCRCARPDCGPGNTPIIREGCWVCVSLATCEDARAGDC